MDELIEEARKGDNESFMGLIQSIENDLYRVAILRLGNIEDINDAIQNTIINIYKNIRKIRNYSYFKTWTIRILINECNKIYRQNKKYEDIKNTCVKNELTYNPSISSTYKSEDDMDFELAINCLNYDEKLVITLMYNSNFSCSEISKILKVNINTVKARILRGKEKLKRYYERRNYTSEEQKQ